MIAGRIVPAMATTTAAITGIACLQIYTLNETNKINYINIKKLIDKLISEIAI